MNGEESIQGLNDLKAATERITVVLRDLMLPGRRERRKAKPVVSMTGISEEDFKRTARP